MTEKMASMRIDKDAFNRLHVFHVETIQSEIFMYF